MPTRPPRQLLVDVRTPAEFATGALSNSLHSAVNIEFEAIHKLPLVYSDLGIEVQRDDAITLYCRSGRRSNIALQTLRNLGYTKVRNLGGLEEARAVLKKEELEMAVPKRETGENERTEARAKSFGALLKGLKELE